jgi:glutamate 5-kinase
VVVDGGAARAIAEMNKSLLPAGIVSVEGPFDRGDLIAVKTSDGTMIARGLTNYASSVVEQIRGKKTTDVRAMLHEAAYDEVIHRDNLVVE